MADPTLALFYEFARNKNLVASQGLGPTLGIVRPTATATVTNSEGLIESVAANIARFDFDPVTKKSLGLLIEEERENIALRSASVAAPWTSIGTPILNATSAIAPDGTLTAASINDNTGAAFEGISQLIPISSAIATYTYSLYLLKTDINSPTFGINWRTTGGSIPVPNPKLRVNTNLSTFLDLNSGINSVEDAGDYWRAQTQITTNTANTNLQMQLFAATSGNNFFADIAAAAGLNTVWGHHAEKGAFALSHIPTLGAPVTRAADVIKTTDISNINTSEGVFYIDFTTGNIGQDTTVLSLDDGTADKRMAIEITGGLIRFIGVDGGVTQWDISTAATADTDFRAAIAYKGNDIEFYLNGVQIGVDSLATIPTFTILHVGCDFADTEQLNEHVRELRHYNTLKTMQFYEDLTSGLISEDNDLTFARHVARPSVRNLARTF